MSWWFDKDQKCTYEEWVDRAGGLMKFLDTYFKNNPCNTILEFGTGNSTRVLAKKCKTVITVDNNKDSIIVPVDEQKSFDKAHWGELKKEDNVIFINDDILTMDLNIFHKHPQPEVILFDLGSTEDDKWIYRVCYERLYFIGLIKDDIVLIADNADTPEVKKFASFLRTQNYEIEDYIGQFVARKVKDDSR